MAGYRIVLAAAALFLASSAEAAPYGFVIDVSLSPKAAAELAKRHEAIIVAAYYEGEPIASKQKYAEDGPLALGTEQIVIAGSGGRALVTGSKVNVKRLGWVKRFDVLINVYSARRSSEFNLLDCGIFEDSVKKAQEKPIPIFCKLIRGE